MVELAVFSGSGQVQGWFIGSWQLAVQSSKFKWQFRYMVQVQGSKVQYDLDCLLLLLLLLLTATATAYYYCVLLLPTITTYCHCLLLLRTATATAYCYCFRCASKVGGSPLKGLCIRPMVCAPNPEARMTLLSPYRSRIRSIAA